MSPIPIGIFASSLAAAPAGAYELIETKLITTNTASVTFSSIPQTYKHLQFITNARANTENPSDYHFIRFNGDSTINYAYHTTVGDGNSVSSNSNIAANSIGQSMTDIRIPGSGNPVGIFGSWVFDILDYSNSSKNQVIRGVGGYMGSSVGKVGIMSGLRTNLSAISSVTFYIGSGSSQYISGSRFSLYGIKG